MRPEEQATNHKRWERQEYRDGSSRPGRAESTSILPDNFEAPSKNITHETIKWNPQEQSWALERLSEIDTAKKPATSNIQGIGLRTLSNEKPQGIFPTVLFTAGIYRRGSHLPNQPREGPRWKEQEFFFRPSKRRVDRWLQAHKCMALD